MAFNTLSTSYYLGGACTERELSRGIQKAELGDQRVQEGACTGCGGQEWRAVLGTIRGMLTCLVFKAKRWKRSRSQGQLIPQGDDFNLLRTANTILFTLLVSTMSMFLCGGGVINRNLVLSPEVL